MEWEDQLHSLWELLAERSSAELEKRIRDLLKDRATDMWLRFCEQLLRNGQLDQAKSLVVDFLRDHPDLPGIRKKLELILLFEQRKSARSPARNARKREQLLQTVNSLVSSGKLVAAEQLLKEALAEGEDPELLDLLGRVYMLQHCPQQATAVMQRALLAEKQQAAFMEPAPGASHIAETDDDVVSDADLDYFATDASTLAGLDVTPSWQDELVEPGKSQPKDPHEAEPGNGTESSQGCEVVVSSAPAPATAEQHAPCVEGRKTLSLGKSRKSGETATLQGVKILVKPATSSMADRAQLMPVPTTIDTPQPPTTDAYEPPRKDPIAASHEQLQAASEPFFSESDIQELVGASEPDTPSAFQHPVTNSSAHPEDDYEPGDYALDNDVLLAEQVESDAELAYEPDIDVGEFDDEYAAYAFDPDDLYDAPIPLESDAELSDGSVSREDRALQKAVELISKAGWPLTVLPLVQQIFVMSGWGATRLALEREIDKGMTPEELILAAHVKVIWAENDYYWIAYDRSGSSNLSQYVLSWPTALLLVRAFESLPQIEELEQFIESLYEYWYERLHLRRAFRSFNRFLWFRMANLQGCLPANQPFSFGSPHELPVEEYSDLGVYDPLDIERTAQLRAFGVFQTKPPQEPSCYFSDKPLPETSSAASAREKSPAGASEDESVELVASAPTRLHARPDPRNLEEHLAMFNLYTEKDATLDV